VEDRRFLILIKLIAIGTVVLTVTYILLVTYSDLAYIQPEEARQPEQLLGRSGDSQIEAAPTTASKIAGASSSGAQSQREERLPLVAEKERQEEAAKGIAASVTPAAGSSAFVRPMASRQEAEPRASSSGQ
jgi:hypothetical protein